MTNTFTPNILLDLDGTLTDPGEGFVNCIRHALMSLDVAPPADAQIASHIGPPLEDTLTILLGDKAESDLPNAVHLYRQRYASLGIFENRLYYGIVDALQAISESGARIFLATSKPQVFAGKILDHFKLASFFTGIYGCQFDGTHADKRELLAYLLQCERIDASQAVMVGDRYHDIRAAKANGVQSVGVLWGYGSETELRDAGADQLIAEPAQLPEAAVARELS